MKLYYSKGACSLAIHIVIHEIGIPCEFEAVDLKSKKTASGVDYLTLNPKGAVPALFLDNGEILTENAVIQQYLADHYQATTLLPPPDNFLRYRVLEWLNFVSTDLHKGCTPLFNADVPSELKESIFKPLLNKRFTYVDQQLGQKPHLMGETFTLPDSYLFVVLTWFPRLGLDLSQWPNLTRYFSQIKQRKAVQQALKEQGLV